MSDLMLTKAKLNRFNYKSWLIVETKYGWKATHRAHGDMNSPELVKVISFIDIKSCNEIEED